MGTLWGAIIAYIDGTYYDDVTEETLLRDIEPCPALVTKINDDDTLELTVFPVGRAPRVKSRVPFVDAPDGDAAPAGPIATRQRFVPSPEPAPTGTPSTGGDDSVAATDDDDAVLGDDSTPATDGGE